MCGHTKASSINVYILSLAFALSIHNKQLDITVDNIKSVLRIKALSRRRQGKWSTSDSATRHRSLKHLTS